MPKNQSRKVTNGPRVYIASDYVADAYRFPICNQFVVEGRGEIDLAAFTHAVHAAAEANPSTRLIYKGWLSVSRLVDSGVNPPVTVLEGDQWSGFDFEGTTFYQRPLPIKTGPTSEVLVFRGDPMRLVFRTHHGITDGQGTFMWISDVFRILRGEAPEGSGHTESIEQFRNITNVREPKWKGEQCVAPTGNPGATPHGISFCRIDVKGPISKLLPKVALLSAKAAWQRNPGGKVVFGIPLSLRPRRPDIHSSSNLSRALYIEVTRDTTIEDIQQRIRAYMEEDGKPALAEKMIPHLPLWVLRRYLENSIKKGLKTGQYWVSGFLSNMGRIPSDLVTLDTFTPERMFAIPPCGLMTPFFLGMMGFNETISIFASMPAHLASDNRDKAFMDYLKENLA
ncbi:MAG: hypothetical protein SWH61_04700 [Thermodesulfobacteriota bacterium]|nr:hypothetical protein [Thermodesulfobacteriota bacterium]